MTILCFQMIIFRSISKCASINLKISWLWSITCPKIEIWKLSKFVNDLSINLSKNFQKYCGITSRAKQVCLRESGQNYIFSTWPIFSCIFSHFLKPSIVNYGINNRFLLLHPTAICQLIKHHFLWYANEHHSSSSLRCNHWFNYNR